MFESGKFEKGWIVLDPPNSNYEAHPNGHVREATSGKILKVYTTGDKYPRVYLNRRPIRLHKIITGVFIGSCPNDCEVNHKDANPNNNSISNLEYVTHSVNMLAILRPINFSLESLLMASNNKPECPNCKGKDVRYRRTDGVSWCRKCGHEWKGDSK